MEIRTEWDFSKHFDREDKEKRANLRKENLEQAELFAKKWRENTAYLSNPKVLKEALDDYENLLKNNGSDYDEAYFLELLRQVNQTDTSLKAEYNRAEEICKKFADHVRFFCLSVAKIPLEKQQEFLRDESLGRYKHFLKRIFDTGKYDLSEAEERIMSKWTTSAYSMWVDMLESLLAKEERTTQNEEGERISAPFSKLMSLLLSKQKDVRDEAARHINDILEKYNDVAEAELNAVLQRSKVNAELRGFERPDTPRHIQDDIEPEVVDALVEAVQENYALAKEFYELKAKLLGQEKLGYHERNVEYGEMKKKYSFEEATTLIHDTFKDLDEEFATIFETYLKEGQIDVYPKKGKVDGAFCAHSLITRPTYILLNHDGSMRDVTTLAHELGHGINNEFMKKGNNALYFDTPKSTAEVASTFMEDFVLERLLKKASDEERLALMMQKLNDDISTITRQIACYRFEQELHETFREKGYLSKEEIGALFQKNMKAYMGDFVEQSSGSENWWVYWSHIRTYFYVYSYASGLLISKALQKKVREDSSFIEKVKVFLAAGTSKAPKEIFLDLDIDISKKEFWTDGLNEVRTLFEETKDLAKKLGKI